MVLDLLVFAHQEDDVRGRGARAEIDLEVGCIIRQLDEVVQFGRDEGQAVSHASQNFFAEQIAGVAAGAQTDEALTVAQAALIGQGLHLVQSSLVEGQGGRIHVDLCGAWEVDVGRKSGYDVHVDLVRLGLADQRAHLPQEAGPDHAVVVGLAVQAVGTGQLVIHVAHPAVRKIGRTHGLGEVLCQFGIVQRRAGVVVGRALVEGQPPEYRPVFVHVEHAGLADLAEDVVAVLVEDDVVLDRRIEIGRLAHDDRVGLLVIIGVGRAHRKVDLYLDRGWVEAHTDEVIVDGIDAVVGLDLDELVGQQGRIVVAGRLDQVVAVEIGGGELLFGPAILRTRAVVDGDVIAGQVFRRSQVG